MAVTNSTIDMTWTAATDNVGVVSYHIYQSTDNVVYTEIHSTDGATYAYTAIGLSEGTKYYFKQTAKDAAGNESLYGNTVEATTLGAATIFDADYQAYLDRLATLVRPLPSVGQQEHQNQLVLDLKAAGVWSKADVISLFATDAGADSSLVNLYPPSQFENIFQNTPVFDAATGWANTGGNGRILPNYIASTDGINYTVNDACIIVHLPLGMQGSTYTFGAYNAAGATHLGNSIATRVNSANSGNKVTQGVYVGVRRNSSTSFDIIEEGLATNVLSTSTDVPPVIMSWIGRAGTDSSMPVNRPIAFGYIGGYLDDTELGNMKIAIDNYMIAIGSLMSTAQVDALLIEADTNGDSNTTIDLSQQAQPRSSVSDTAVANLISRNNTIITN